MISPDLSEALNVIERIARDDADTAAASRLRSQYIQEVNREEADALAERARLAEAEKNGTLVKERHGFDDDGRATLEREPDTKRLRDADARISAIRRRKAALTAPAQGPRLTAVRIQSELAKHSHAKFVEVQRPALPLRKNERPIDALPRFRQASLDLHGDRRNIEKAALSFAEVETAAHREIDKIADRGLPKTLGMFQGGRIKWPRNEVEAGNDVLAVVAFLMRDNLKAELSKLIKINAGAFPNALTAEEKAERLAALNFEIDAAERIEAACVEAIIAEGGTEHHRPDIAVLAVLSLRTE